MGPRGLEKEFKLLRNARETRNRQQRAPGRQIAHRAVHQRGVCMHENLAGLQGPDPWDFSPFRHGWLRLSAAVDSATGRASASECITGMLRNSHQNAVLS